MKIFFIDETDRQKDGQRARAYFVLCGLIIDADDLIKVDSELEDIKKQHHINSLKVARKARLNKSEKLEITNEIFSILKKYNIEVRAVYLGELTMRSERKVSDTYLGALDFLVERLFLSLKKNNTTGLIVMDNLNHKTEAKLKKKFFKYIQNESQIWVVSGKKDPYKSRVCSWLLFSDDDTNTFLQVTDLIASSLNSAIWNAISDNDFDVEKLSGKNEYLKVYWPLFAKSSTGKVSGWGVKIWN
ncbi:MAG: DUF3800 domain-containing protein [Candidatus Pacebacteria bacterium]|nr:DUF3800 domain-containing protein [Candidatus Paceibacterota bacterium]